MTLAYHAYLGEAPFPMHGIVGPFGPSLLCTSQVQPGQGELRISQCADPLLDQEADLHKAPIYKFVSSNNNMP